VDRFSIISEYVHQVFDVRNQARDKALTNARQVIRQCSQAIRAIHRMEVEAANLHLAEAQQLVNHLKSDLASHPDLFHTGYTQDAIKEYVEAKITCALIQGQEIPLPAEIDVDADVYLNGLAEVVGELRRRCMDILRQGYSDDAIRLLELMDEIYSLLITVDYPDALTNGLRRQTDLARGIVERTRGDITISIRENRLAEAMKQLSKQLLQEDISPSKPSFDQAEEED
jgi:translin